MDIKVKDWISQQPIEIHDFLRLNTNKLKYVCKHRQTYYISDLISFEKETFSLVNLRFKKVLCKECNEQIYVRKSTQARFSRHLMLQHKLTPREYYDKHLMKKGEGICPICRKETAFWNIDDGYAKYCCITCCNKDTQHIDNIKNTCLDRYGVSCVFKDKQIKEKNN